MPKKRPNLLSDVARCLTSGEYFDTFHSTTRLALRGITRADIEHVLRSGWHERSKDSFDVAHAEWNYAIRGVTIDDRRLRVIVSFDEEVLVIVTAIDLDR